MKEAESEVEFAAAILIGSENYGRTCINGLPLTPSSIRLLGRFQKLLSLNHKNICQYIELIRSQNSANAVFVVSEHYSKVLSWKELENTLIIPIITQLIDCLRYLHSQDIIIGHLSTDNILITPSKKFGLTVKLCQYGLNYITGNGEDVNYLIADAYYLSPERIIKMIPGVWKGPASKKSDVWALGIILVEFFIKMSLKNLWSLQQYTSILHTFCQKSQKKTCSFFNYLMQAIKIAKPTLSVDIDEKIISIIEKCLQLLPSVRPRLDDIYNEIEIVNNNHYFDQEEEEFSNHMKEVNAILNLQNLEGVKVYRPLTELFFLWKLCGSNIEAILKPGEQKFARVIIDDYKLCGKNLETFVKTPFNLIILPSSNLKTRLKKLECEDTHNLNSDQVETPSKFVEYIGQTLIVKERNIEYQSYRMALMRDLLLTYPYTLEMLKTECKKDIPPVYRGALWAALLDVHDDVNIDFDQLDTFPEQASDRQLMVDIPRCHQYEELMTSPAAHIQLKKLLKAWLLANPNYVYWQGLDSLAAPFLVHHFNNLPKAFGCLQNFIQRYLQNFFLKDNSHIIQEYLAVFTQLLAFIDSKLYFHLNEMDFCAELFAIPWFLTCFAHVLPLHKLFHLWDTLLLTDSSFTLFIGIAILVQMRQQLLNSQFNDAILLFSDLPDLSIDKIVADSLCYYHSVPPSCSHRIYSSEHLRDNATPLMNISLNELRTFHCPRISPTDLINLIDHNRVLLLDIRSTTEFNMFSLPNSINIAQNCYDFNSSSFYSIIKSQLSVARDHKKDIIMSLMNRRSKKIPNLRKMSVSRTISVANNELDYSQLEVNSCPNSPAVKKVFRLVIVGSARTGKTAIVNRFLEEQFEERYLPTIENFHRKVYKRGGEVYQMDIVDCSGMDPFPAARKLSYATGDMFIIVSSVDHPESLNHMLDLHDQIIECKLGKGLPIQNIPMIYVLNKTDLPRVKWQHNEAEFANKIIQFTGSQNKHILCSAKLNENMDVLFVNLFQQARLPKFMCPGAHRALRTKHSADEYEESSSSRGHLLRRMREKFSRESEDECYTQLNARRSSLRTDLLLTRAKSMERRNKTNGNKIGHKISIKYTNRNEEQYVVEAVTGVESHSKKCVIM
uniref:TBC domain-containing protein kinase-like protein n=1 Tax=Parastrongyloides trichosuri TaxID=131310 RepID=A0A0N4ZHR5_PARTI